MGVYVDRAVTTMYSLSRHLRVGPALSVAAVLATHFQSGKVNPGTRAFCVSIVFWA